MGTATTLDAARCTLVCARVGRHSLRRMFAGMLIMISLLLAAPLAAHAATPSTYPDDGFITDGAVRAITTDTAGRTYYGGTFQRIGAYTGSAVIRDSALGELPLHTKFDGPVTSAISDGHGGWFVGGSFQRANNLMVGNLAHLFADGTLDTEFGWGVDLAASPQPTHVDALLLTSTGKLVIGGSFANLRGPSGTTVAQSNVAVLNLTQGTSQAQLESTPTAITPVTALAETSPGVTQSTIWFARSDDGVSTSSELVGWRPDTHATNTAIGTVSGVINTLAVTPDGRLIVGGQFSVGQFASAGTTYAAMAIGADGTTTGPGTWQGNQLVETRAIAVNPAAGGFVYLGGTGDVANIRAVNASTGAVVTSFTPPVDPSTGAISAMAFVNNSLIVGRAEGTLGAPPRPLVARLATSGSVMASPILPERPLRVMSISGSSILFGGDFAAATSTPRMNVARVTPTTNAVDSSWRVAVNTPVVTDTPVTSMTALSNGGVAIGGTFTSAGLVDPASSSTVSSPVLSLLGDAPASGLITVDAAGTITGRHTAAAATSYRVDDLAAANGTLMAVASNLTATTQTETVTAFSESAVATSASYLSTTPASGTTAVAAADAKPFSIVASPQVSPGTGISIYLGGGQRTWQRYASATSLPVTGAASTFSRLVKASWTSAGAFTDPVTVYSGGDDRGDPDALYLSPTDSTRLWVGGTYARPNGITLISQSSNLVAVNTADGSLNFPANWTHNYPNKAVRSIVETAGQLVVGGEFTNASTPLTKAPQYLMSYAVNQGTWNITPWAPRPTGMVSALEPTATNTVIAGGAFAATDRRISGGIGHFAQPVTAVPPSNLQQTDDTVAGSPQSITPGSTIASGSVSLSATLGSTGDRRPQGLTFTVTKDGTLYTTITRLGGWRPDTYGTATPPPANVALTNLPDGRYTWSVNAISADADAGPPATIAAGTSPSFIVDRAPPVRTAGSTLLAGASGASPAWLSRIDARRAAFTDLSATTSTLCISASSSSCTNDPTAPQTGIYTTWPISSSSTVASPAVQPTLTTGSIYYICQQEVDVAGNRSMPICSPGFAWDATPPTALVVDALGTTTGPMQSIPISVRDDESGIDRIVIERATSAAFTSGVVSLATIRPTSLTLGTFSTSYQWNTAGLTGTYSIRVTAFDAAGNTVVSPVQTTTIDRAPPGTPSLVYTMLPDPTWAYRASDTSPLIVHGCCGDTGTLRITAAAGIPDDVASVQFSLIDGSWPSTTPLPWSVPTNRTYNYLLATGTQLHGPLGVRVRDGAGNSAETTIDVHTDRFAPHSSLSTPPPLASHDNITFAMTAVDPPDGGNPQAGVDRIDTNVRPLASGTVSAPVWGLPLTTNPVVCSGLANSRSCSILNATNQSLPDGIYGLETVASDMVRNVEVPAPPTPFIVDHESPDVTGRTLTLPAGTTGARIDTTATPPVLWIKPGSSGSVNVTVAANVHDALSGIANVRFAGLKTCTEYTAPPAAPAVTDYTASCTLSFSRAAAPDQTYAIVATDRAGNIGPNVPSTSQFVVRYDGAGPALPPFGDGQVTMLGTTAAFAGTFANDADIEDWKLERVDPITGTRSLLAPDTTIARPGWRATWDTTGIADGQYPIILTLHDALGNTASTPYLFIVNRSTNPATPDIQSAVAGSEGSAATLTVAWNPNADQDLTDITLEVRKRTGTLLDPPQTMTIPAGVARLRGAATPTMSAGTTGAAFTLIDDRRDIRLLPGATYEIRVRSSSSRTTGQYSDPTVVALPLANGRMTTTQLSTDDAARACGDSANKCHYASGESARILGDIDLATFAVGRRINVSLYQLRNGSWQLDDTFASTVNLTGDFLVKLGARSPGVYRADVLLPPGPLLQTGVSTEYLVWGK